MSTVQQCLPVEVADPESTAPQLPLAIPAVALGEIRHVQPEPLMTARQVSRYLQTTPRRVVDLWKKGQLKGFWLHPSGRRDLRFRRSDVEAFLEARSHPTKGPAVG